MSWADPNGSVKENHEGHEGQDKHEAHEERTKNFVLVNSQLRVRD
jgi:hypothetical protein